MYAEQDRDNISAALPQILWARWWYQRENLEADLHDAVRHREFEVYYQPKVNLISGMMRGVEALLRWRHPVLGLLAPSVFLPLAEESGAIVEIGQWLIEEVCRQAAEWVEPGFETSISINVSEQQLRKLDWIDVIALSTSRQGIRMQAVELELREPKGIEDRSGMVRQLARLRERGVRVMLDGFGGNLAKFSALSDLPLDGVKIDRSLIRRIDWDSDARRIVSEVVAVAREAGLETVAEGVERKSQAACLQALGFSSAQGYYYAKPGPSYRLEYWMEGKV